MLKIGWTDKVRNERILHRIEEEMGIWKTLIRRRDMMIGHVLRHQGITSMVLEGAVESKNCRGTQRLEFKQQITEDVCCKCYFEMKRLARESNSRWATSK